MKVLSIIQLLLIIALLSFYFSCSNGDSVDKKRTLSEAEKKYYDHTGIGPVMELNLEKEIDQVMSKEGEKLFLAKCISCHQITEEKRIGPGLKDVTLRRRPEWIMNQILNPMEMVKKDSLAKELFLIYQVQMIDLALTKEQARCILEYFRAGNQ